MMGHVRSMGLRGLDGYEISVECYITNGLPGFDVVGLPDAAVKEARERVRAAIKNCGYKFPVSRITLNLAPAGTKKTGTLYDLPILLGILEASGLVKLPKQPCAFLGELSLEGKLRPVTGVLPMALAAKKLGVEALYVPKENAAEATLAEGLRSTVWKVFLRSRRTCPARRPLRRRSPGDRSGTTRSCRISAMSRGRRTSSGRLRLRRQAGTMF